MAYNGYIGDIKYCKRDKEEIIEKSWTFTNSIKSNLISTHSADLAEIYLANKNEVLIPGTLVRFGGKYEITKTLSNGREYFGVISTSPGVVLNKKENNGEKVALVGRVPVRVVGTIKKFDKITTSKYPGIAKRKTLLDILLLKPTIGTSLQTNTNDNEKLVEVFVHAEK